MRALLLAFVVAHAAPLLAQVTVDVRARSLVPGDLVRIDVAAPAPLARVSGTLRGDALDFVPACDGGAAPCASWAAWEALDIDWEPGPIELVVAADGQRLTRTLTLAAKSFPTQELKVEGKFVEPPKAARARIEREQKELAAVYSRRTPLPPPSAWKRPVGGEPTGVFGARRVFNGQKRKPHPGLDLRAKEGTPVACSGAGVVALAKDLYFSGGTVIVDHGAGLFTIYAHLSRIDVKLGDRLHAGDGVGLSGATGRVTGPHLHWGGKVGDRIFDPTSLLDPALGTLPSR